MNPSPIVVVDRRPLMRGGIATLLSRHLDRPVDPVPALRAIDSLPSSTVVVLGEVEPGDAELAARTGARVVRLAECVDIPALAVAVRLAVNDTARVHRAPQIEDRPNPLTARELAVLRAVSGGASAAQIAGELGISPRTVERHKQSVMAKLGVPNQAQAVARSIELRLLDEV